MTQQEKLKKLGKVARFIEINKNPSLAILNLENRIEDKFSLSKGDKGDRGMQGNRGLDGRNGKDGRNGFDGKDGKDGINGKNGESIRGPMGPQGKPGKDAILNENELVKKILAKIPIKLQTKSSNVAGMPPIPQPHLLIKSSGSRIAEGIREINFTGGTVTRVSGDQVSVALGSSATIVHGEVVSGSGTSWTIAHTPTGNVSVYAQGIRLSVARGDYTIVGTTITTSQAYTAGDLEINYEY